MRIWLISFLAFICTGLLAQEDTQIFRSVSYTNKALEMAKEKKYDTAIILIDSAMLFQKNNSGSFHVKAEFLWMKKDFLAAANAYQTAILLDDDSSFLFGAYLHLGVLYEMAGILDKAQSQYLKAVYLFENKANKLHKYFEMQDNMDYSLALLLSGKLDSFEKIIGKKPAKEWLAKYLGKSRQEVIEIYFSEYMP